MDDTCKQKKILILSGSFGEGHMKASKAIVEASTLYNPEMIIEVADFMEWVHPKLHVIERYAFLQVVNHLPQLYDFCFQKSRSDNTISYMLRQIWSFTQHRLLKRLQDSEPTIIISTFPPAAAAISLLIEKGLTDLPSYTVITDHTDHSYWIHPETTLYLVGSEWARRSLQQRGVPVEKIVVTGIPVSLAYHQTFYKTRLREQCGIASNSFVVLVMGGGWGVMDKDFIEQMKQEDPDKNIIFIVICGRNHKLLKHFQNTFKEREDVRLEGYVENIHEWMALSDVLITKPGGLTISEALAVSLPMLLLKPKLGQERDNAKYLIHTGAAMLCSTKGLRQQLRQLIDDKQFLSKMRHQAQIHRNRNSALQAITTILGSYRDQESRVRIRIWDEPQSTIRLESAQVKG